MSRGRGRRAHRTTQGRRRRLTWHPSSKGSQHCVLHVSPCPGHVAIRLPHLSPELTKVRNHSFGLATLEKVMRLDRARGAHWHDRSGLRVIVIRWAQPAPLDPWTRHRTWNPRRKTSVPTSPGNTRHPKALTTALPKLLWLHVKHAHPAGDHGDVDKSVPYTVQKGQDLLC